MVVDFSWEHEGPNLGIGSVKIRDMPRNLKWMNDSYKSVS